MINDVEVEVRVNVPEGEKEEVKTKRLKISITDGRVYFELKDRGDSAFYYITFVDIVENIKEKYG